MGKTMLRMLVKFYRWHIKHLQNRQKYYRSKLSIIYDWNIEAGKEIKEDKKKLIQLESKLYKIEANLDYPELEGGE